MNDDTGIERSDGWRGETTNRKSSETECYTGDDALYDEIREGESVGDEGSANQVGRVA